MFSPRDGEVLGKVLTAMRPQGPIERKKSVGPDAIVRQKLPSARAGVPSLARCFKVDEEAVSAGERAVISARFDKLARLQGTALAFHLMSRS